MILNIVTTWASTKIEHAPFLQKERKTSLARRASAFSTTGRCLPWTMRAACSSMGSGRRQGRREWRQSDQLWNWQCRWWQQPEDGVMGCTDGSTGLALGAAGLLQSLHGWQSPLVGAHTRAGVIAMDSQGSEPEWPAFGLDNPTRNACLLYTKYCFCCSGWYVW